MTFATGMFAWMTSSCNWKKIVPQSYWFTSQILPIRARRPESSICRSRAIHMVDKLSYLIMDLRFCLLRDENTPADSTGLEICINIQTVAWARILWPSASTVHRKSLCLFWKVWLIERCRLLTVKSNCGIISATKGVEENE